MMQTGNSSRATVSSSPSVMPSDPSPTKAKTGCPGRSSLVAIAAGPAEHGGFDINLNDLVGKFQRPARRRYGIEAIADGEKHVSVREHSRGEFRAHPA